MKRKEAGTVAVGAVLIAYAFFACTTGGVAGRSGSIAVTRARDPYVFWIALTLLMFCGVFAVSYGLAKGLNWAVWFTARVDAFIYKAGSGS